MPSAKGIRAGRAFVELFADDSRLVRGLRRASARLRAFGAQISAMGKRMLAVSAMMALPLVAGGKVYADFEKQMANVSTMLDQPVKHMAGFRDAIRKMSVEFGESTDTLAGGLYDILSASIDPAKALDVLAVSAKAAKAGLTDTKTAADAITTILNSYGMSAEEAERVSDVLFQTVRRGKTTFADLAPQIGQVASTAAMAGVEIEELGGLLALLTRNGIRTENAVTAVNRIIMTFLKPSDEAARYAKKLGFNMNTATLQAEGLEGVFKRISKLPPEAIAKLFPNVRAIKGVIPALKDFGALQEDISAMGNSAGAMETAYGKMADTLSHKFAQMKQSVVVSFSMIGEALAGTATDAAAAIMKFSAAASQWIAQNRGIIITVAKLIGVVAALGAGMLILGTVISTLGTMLGFVTTALKIVFVAIGALLSPIGLVIAAMGALGFALVNYTNAGGKATVWLGDRFSDLSSVLTTSLGAMGAALARGDLGLAAKILWLTLKQVWYKGVAYLQQLWFDFKNYFVKVGFGFLAVVEKVWYKLESAWIETTAFFAKAWYGFVSFFKKTWERIKSGAKKTWNWIKSLFDDSVDLEKENKLVEQQKVKAIRSIEEEYKRKSTERDKERQRQRAEAEAGHRKRFAAIGQKYSETERQMKAEQASEIAAREKELLQAKKEWQDAVADALKKPEKKDPELDTAGKQMEDIKNTLQKATEGISASISSATAEWSTRQTFGGALFGMEFSSKAQDAEDAAIQTAKNTKQLVDLTRDNQMEYGA